MHQRVAAVVSTPVHRRRDVCQAEGIAARTFDDSQLAAKFHTYLAQVQQRQMMANQPNVSGESMEGVSLESFAKISAQIQTGAAVEGLVAGEGNTITGVSVTRGRKLPCIDPDAGFDEPDGPDVVRFAAVAECIEHSLLPTFVEELPDNELRSMAAVLHDDAPAVAAVAALPAPSAEAKTIDPAQAIAHFGLRGSSDATDPKVSVVECGGYDCSFCNRARETVAELRERYGDALSFHFLQMPLDMHPTGSVAARAAVAAALQGNSWEMHELLFDEPSLRTEAALIERAATLGLDADRFAHDLTDPATAQSVADQREVCTAAGARGTPSFFINGDLLVGSQAIDAFVEIIDDELATPGA